MINWALERQEWCPPTPTNLRAEYKWKRMGVTKDLATLQEALRVLYFATHYFEPVTPNHVVNPRLRKPGASAFRLRHLATNELVGANRVPW